MAEKLTIEHNDDRSGLADSLTNASPRNEPSTLNVEMYNITSTNVIANNKRISGKEGNNLDISGQLAIETSKATSTSTTEASSVAKSEMKLDESIVESEHSTTTLRPINNHTNFKVQSSDVKNNKMHENIVINTEEVTSGMLYV